MLLRGEIIFKNTSLYFKFNNFNIIKLITILKISYIQQNAYTSLYNL